MKKASFARVHPHSMSATQSENVASCMPSYWFEQYFDDDGKHKQMENDRKHQKETQFIFRICKDPQCEARTHLIKCKITPSTRPHKLCLQQKHDILIMCRICRQPISVPPNYSKPDGDYFLYHRRNHCFFSQQSSVSDKISLPPPLSPKHSMDTRGYALIDNAITKEHITYLLNYGKRVKKKFTPIFNEDINVFTDIADESTSTPKPQRLQFALPDSKNVIAIRDSIFSLLVSQDILSDAFQLYQPVLIHSKKGCKQQAFHMDTGRHTQSFGILVALSNPTYLLVIDNNPQVDVDKPHKLTIPKGALVIFKGSTIHAGAAYECENFRLHFYASQTETRENFTFRPNALLLRHLKAQEEKEHQNKLCATSLKRKRQLLKQQ